MSAAPAPAVPAAADAHRSDSSRDVAHRARLPILDGWRAVSILLVLATHLLPLGPKSLNLNATAGGMGMALFFTLSGFLIVRFLAEGMTIPSFIARRLARIVPLSWLAMLFLTVTDGATAGQAMPSFLFYANLPPIRLLEGGEHLWSICVEMQFYAVVVLLALLPRRRGLYLVPLLCLAITAVRVGQGVTASIVTWDRVDEILAGGVLALIYCGWLGDWPRHLLGKLGVWPMLVLLFLTSHPALGPLGYLRPYAGALLVGSSLFSCPPSLARVLQSRPMAYVAEISYALYIIHGVLAHSWLGAGDTLQRYLKRPLLFAVTFLLAHLSTRYFERPITRWARGAASTLKPANTTS